jgi:hypothetical protein
MTGWWYTYPFEKYEFVSWDDSSHFWKIIKVYKSHVPNHQPDDINVSTALYVFAPLEPIGLSIPFFSTPVEPNAPEHITDIQRLRSRLQAIFGHIGPEDRTRSRDDLRAAELVVAPGSKFINHSMDIFTKTIVNQVISQLS